MLTRFKALILGLAACAGLAGVAAAQNADVGYNPVTGLRGLLGVPLALGTPPVMTGCNTSAPSYKGGAETSQITTAGTTTCAPVFTFTIPALGAGGVSTNAAGSGYSQSVFAPTLTGMSCGLKDLTTVADTFTQSATAYTAPTATASGSLTCSFTSRSITSGDVLLLEVHAY